MFGMLDYRAHKLYKVLVYPVAYLIRLIGIFLLPAISYALGVHFASSEVVQAAIAVVAYFLIGIPWYFVVKIILGIPEAIFNFLIDVIPAGGRTKDQAAAVVRGGEPVIDLINFNNGVDNWTEELIEKVSRRGFFSLFYGDLRSRRLHILREYYLQHSDIALSEYHSNRVLKEGNIYPNLIEIILTNIVYRGWALSLGVLVLLLIWNPLYMAAV